MSEQIKNDHEFLELFDSSVLNAMIEEDHFLPKAIIFRSGPGGGKTSLFRLFWPNLLKEISNQRNQQHKKLYAWFDEYGLINKDKINLLGVYTVLNKLDMFDEINTTADEKINFFFSLIGYRLILIMLNGILKLYGLSENKLETIIIKKPSNHSIPNLSFPCNGKDLYEWATKKEQKIIDMMHSFKDDVIENNPLSNIEHFHLINPKNIFLDDKIAVENILIMLDDVHLLPNKYRELLLKRLTRERLPVSIWFAERLQVLNIRDLIPGISNREYDVVYLEENWRTGKHVVFEKFITSVSDNRINMANKTNSDIQLNSLSYHLKNSIDSEKNISYKNIFENLKNDLKIVANHKNTLSENAEPLSYDGAVKMRVLKIMQKRNEQNVQKKIVDDPNIELGTYTETNQNLIPAAEFFIHLEYSIPYFFGFTNITKLATFNVEQFLKIAAQLFDRIDSKLIKNENSVLSPKIQENIIKSVSEFYFDEISKNTNEDVKLFLKNLGTFANAETIKPTAPYNPGVTGFGIQKKYYDEFTDPKNCDRYKKLITTLESCLQHNYIKATYDARQGNEDVIKFYLNRLFCPHFELPLGYGGWRPKTPQELCDWL